MFWLRLRGGAQLSVLTVFISNGNLFYSERTMWRRQLHED